MTRVQLQPAYVLHSRPYRDTSLILEVLTAEQGRVAVVARGARRQRRGASSGAGLQPFLPLLLSFAGRGEMKTLTGQEVAGPGPALRGERLFSALYVNELLVRLLHRHDPHPLLFARYGETLAALAAPDDPGGPLREFEFCLLDELGYGFALDLDGFNGAPVRPGARYRFQAEYGLVEDLGVAEGPERGFQGAHLLALARGEMQGEAGLTAKRLARQALASQLGPEPLHSRDLFRAGRREAGA